MTRERALILLRPLLTLSIVLTLLAPRSSAQSDQATDANLAARRWFQDAKFGMFIHWGVYSTLQDGEWVMQNRKISIADYEKLPSQFNP